MPRKVSAVTVWKLKIGAEIVDHPSVGGGFPERDLTTMWAGW